MKHQILLIEVTNTSRLFIADSAAPEGKRTQGSKIYSYSRTTTTRVPLRTIVNGEAREGMEQVPVINANLLRGRLRRNIAMRIFDSLRARKKGISVDLIHLLTSLASSGSPSSAKNIHNAMLADDPVEEFTSKNKLTPRGDECLSTDNRTEYLTRMTSDPFVALFGGGPNLWRSRLVTPDLMPNLTALQVPHLINNKYAHKFDRSPMADKPYELFEQVAAIRGDDVYKNANYLEPESPELATWIKIESGAGGKKAEKGEDGPKSNLRNIMEMQTIRPGVPFIGEITIKSDDVASDTFDIMAGLIQVALNDLDQEQIGGLIRNGWGKVNVKIEEGENKKQMEKALAYIETVTVDNIMEAFGVALR